MRMKYSSKEFDSDRLPSSRWKQFFSIIKLEWKTLLKIGLFLLILGIVFFLLEFGEYIVDNSFYNALKEEGKLDTYLSIKSLIMIIYDVTLIIVYVLGALLLSGITRVIRRLVYGEGVLFKEDFLEGIRINFKQYLIIALIYFAISFVANANYAMVMAWDNVYTHIIQGISIGILFGLITPIFLYMFTQSSTYKMTLGQNFSNSYKLYFSSIIVGLLFSFALFGFTCLDYINNIIIRVLIQAGIIFLLMPLYILAWHCFAVSQFDRYINEDNYPEIYRKGLKPLWRKDNEDSREKHD